MIIFLAFNYLSDTNQFYGRMHAYCQELSKGRTAKLWIQYMDMVELLRQFIRAERTGNWQLHLSTLQKMLPFFAASGHNLYAKSAHIYLTNMYDLPTTNNQLYQHFMKGLHVIRRSDRFWAGLSTDLVIEQSFMRSLKSVGGLTRGRGLTEIQRSIWTLSRPSTSELNAAMQKLCGTQFETSEQHKESTPSMQKRDEKDTVTVTDFLKERNPIKGGEQLRSISSGVISKDGNPDKAKEIGEAIVSKLPGLKVNEVTFRRKDTVHQLNDKVGMRIDGDHFSRCSSFFSTSCLCCKKNLRRT